jgi:hypothetical protein
MALKNYMAKINLKSGGGVQEVRVQAKSHQDAKRLIEAQFAGQIKSWFHSPKEVK